MGCRLNVSLLALMAMLLLLLQVTIPALALKRVVAPPPDQVDDRGSDGDDEDAQGIVFAAISRPEDVALFGRQMPHGSRMQILITTGEKCMEGGKMPKEQGDMDDLRASGKKIECIFDGRVRTPALHAVCQAVRCEHPPEHERESLYGKLVTVTANNLIAKSRAVYLPPPPKMPLHAPRNHTVCACLQLWNRADHLLEWLRYYVHMMGVTKVFVYDNDSKEDKLKEKVDWLKLGYDIVWNDWPEPKTQLAFNGHCTLSALDHCEWLTVMDIDEFVWIHPAAVPDGRLDSMLLKQKPEVGALALWMATVIDGGCHIERPLGGVLNNYICMPKEARGNTKHILRPKAVHPSLFSSAHYGCYRRPYKKFQCSRSYAFLYHYKMQAWQEFMKKYQRRAGLGSRRFATDDGKPVSPYKPTKEFLTDCTACQVKDGPMRNDTTMAEFYLCHSSWKVAGFYCEEGTDDNELNSLLITGTGGIGSGMHAVAQWFSLHKADDPTRSPVVSWELAFRDKNYPLFKEWSTRPHRRFHTIFHQVQHPLHAIKAIMTLPEQAWYFIQKHTPVVTPRTSLLTRALHHWVTWNHFIESIADWRFRVEETDLVEICVQAGLQHCASANGGVLNLNKLPHVNRDVDVTWQMLEEADPLVADMAKAMAVSYGYDVTVDA